MRALGLCRRIMCCVFLEGTEEVRFAVSTILFVFQPGPPEVYHARLKQ